VLRLLITTGKNPDSLQKLIAKALFLATPGSRLEGRGKRAIASLVEHARLLRFSRLCIIGRTQDGASEISFLSVGTSSWSRIPPAMVANYGIACKDGKAWKQEQSVSLAVRGARRKTILNLLGVEEGDWQGSQIKAEAKSIIFRLGPIELLKLGVRYGG